MKKYSLIQTMASLFCILFLTAPIQAQEKWYKGNLHTHSYWSDGDEFPEIIMEWYKNEDYNFVALSDHNIIAEGEKWKKIRNDSLYQQAFQHYLNKYGEDWINYRRDSSGLHVQLKTLEEFRPLFEEDEKFMIFRAEEVTAYLEGKAVHMGAINLDAAIEPRKGNTVAELIQNNLDAIMEQGEKSGRPVLQHLNHPNFTYAIAAEDIIQVDGERFFEVFNGHPYVNNYGDSIHSSTEEMWDQVNIAYLDMGKPLLYGLATDDSHNYHNFGLKFSNAGRGWVMVKTDKLHPHSLIRSMEAGNFYSTTGVIMKDIFFNDNQLDLKIKPEKDVEYTIQFITAKENEPETSIVKVVNGTEASYRLKEDELFVRAKIISTKPKKNPYREGDLEVAWIQPHVNKK